jgi:hypothetical protein
MKANPKQVFQEPKKEEQAWFIAETTRMENLEGHTPSPSCLASFCGTYTGTTTLEACGDEAKTGARDALTAPEQGKRGVVSLRCFRPRHHRLLASELPLRKSTIFQFSTDVSCSREESKE